MQVHADLGVSLLGAYTPDSFEQATLAMLYNINEQTAVRV